MYRVTATVGLGFEAYLYRSSRLAVDMAIDLYRRYGKKAKVRIWRV